MFRPLVLLLSFSLTAPLVLSAQQQPASAKSEAADRDAPWMVESRKRHDELVARNGLGKDAALQAQLLAMRDTDQDARGVAHGEAKDKDKLRMATNMSEIDTQLTAELKDIVAKHGWPTIATVGIDASNAAMLVLTHTTDHAWQLSLLPLLTKLADEGRIDGVPLALVIDKELVSEGKLQRYGTQFKYVDGAMAMYGVEDPGGLDTERARLGLPPMDVYKQQLEAMYHLKATEKVVMATAPAK